MKAVTIDRTSWHYWFANFGSSANTNDFCAYVRSVFGGMFLFLFMAAVIVLVCGVFGTTLGWLCACIFVGWTEPQDLALGGLVCLLFAVIATVIFWSGVGIKTITRNNEFVRDAYTSIKDKVCFQVRVE